MKKMTITLLFEKNANFSAENCPKSQKIMIITSIPGKRAQNIAENASWSRHGSQSCTSSGEPLWLGS
jgi:hypothetical protein